nr:hypothetical protein [Tanacetum cinerariifolium]
VGERVDAGYRSEAERHDFLSQERYRQGDAVSGVVDAGALQRAKHDGSIVGVALRIPLVIGQPQTVGATAANHGVDAGNEARRD